LLIGLAAWTVCSGCGTSADSAAPSPSRPSPAGANVGALLASRQAAPVLLALDDDEVYWLDMGLPDSSNSVAGAGRILSCAKTGCDDAPREIVSGITQVGGFVGLAVTAGKAYFADERTADAGGSRILQCSVEACAPTLVAPSLTSGIAADATRLYFTHAAEVDSVSTSRRGAAAPLWSGDARSALEGTWAITADADRVYFTTGVGDVLACPIAGCGGAPTVLATGEDAPSRIAVDSSSVYWVTTTSGGMGRVRKCAKTGCGNAPTTLTSHRPWASAIAVDGVNVYTTEPGTADADGSLVICSVDGCDNQPTVLASGQRAPFAVVVDDAYVYWANEGSDSGNGEIRRLMKPPSPPPH
jgi:hypothetical protein